MQSSVAVINVPQHQQTFVAAINFRTKTTPREFIDGELNFLGKFFFLPLRTEQRIFGFEGKNVYSWFGVNRIMVYMFCGFTCRGFRSAQL